MVWRVQIQVIKARTSELLGTNFFWTRPELEGLFTDTLVYKIHFELWGLKGPLSNFKTVCLHPCSVPLDFLFIAPYYFLTLFL